MKQERFRVTIGDQSAEVLLDSEDPEHHKQMIERAIAYVLEHKRSPVYRLTEGDLDAAEQTYHDARRGRLGTLCTLRAALEHVVRQYMRNQAQT